MEEVKHINIPRLIGDKINLCPVREDEEALYLYTKWMNDASFLHFISRVDTVTTINAEREWVENRKGKLAFNIVVKEDDRLIGNCGIAPQNVYAGHYSLGICIGETDCHSKGYGTEVIKMLCKFAFDVLNASVVSLQMNCDNARARRCYEKAGLKLCGVVHDALFYDGVHHDLGTMEILRQDYYSKNTVDAD